MFILVFRPHQGPAWCFSYDSEEDFIDSFQRDHFARSCHAECTSEDIDAMDGKPVAEAFAIAFDRVGHDLSCLTRLDSAEEVERYLTERDYCGQHNKGYTEVEREARDIGWIAEEDEPDEDEQQPNCDYEYPTV